MLESYLKSSKEVKQLLFERNQLGKLANIDDEIIGHVVDFLKPFKECSETFSGDKYPTLHRVALWRHTLLDHLLIKEADGHEMIELKLQATVCFEEYMEIQDLHYAACMLDPRYKKLKFANDDFKARAHLFLQSLISSEESGAGNTDGPAQDIVNRDLLSVGSAPKKSRFDELQDSDDEDNLKSELDRYIATPLAKDGKNPGFDVLRFWCGATQFPNLRKIASWLLAIPASQASDERVFSSTGFTLNSRRTELSGSTLSSLTFIHKNY